jgi:hypothetical protein
MSEIRTYHAVDITFAGKPLGEASPLMASEPGKPLAPFAPRMITFAATFTGSSSFAAFRDLAPSTPVPVNVTKTWGILGPIAFPAGVDGATVRGTPEGTETHLDLAVDEPALRRALSMAVQKAIVSRPQRIAAVSRAILGDSRDLYALGAVVLRKRGERKKRKAMRRLLRAAGITGASR